MNSKALKARDRSSFPLFRAFSAIVFGEWHSPGPLAQAITLRAHGADIRSFPQALPRAVPYQLLVSSDLFWQTHSRQFE